MRELREIKAPARSGSEWVTQKYEEDKEWTEIWGHCDMIWSDQKPSPRWTVLNFPPNNNTCCRTRRCSSKIMAFCSTSCAVFSVYLMGCVAVQPQVQSKWCISLLEALIMLGKQSECRFIPNSLIFGCRWKAWGTH